MFNRKITMFKGKITMVKGRITMVKGKITMFKGKTYLIQIVTLYSKEPFCWLSKFPFTTSETKRSI